MPQEHYVLRCFSCETFQAHIVKKAKKWECKMCGEKQSLKRNYGKGSGKDCRNQVMKLNELRLRNDCNSIEAENETLDDGCKLSELKEESDSNKPLTSKWEKYLDEPVKDAESKVEDCVTDIYGPSEEKKKKRVKTMSEDYSNKNKKICRDSDPIEVSSPTMSQLFSPPSDKKIESYKSNEKVTEMNRSMQTNYILKSNKYAKYLDDDVDDNTDDCHNKDIGSGKENDINKLPSIFDSDPNDLDNILSHILE